MVQSAIGSLRVLQVGIVLLSALVWLKVRIAVDLGQNGEKPIHCLGDLGCVGCGRSAKTAR
jgi:hypothetical protein